MVSIPVPKRGVSCVDGVPQALQDARQTISRDDLMNSANNLSDYISNLCKYVTNNSDCKTMAELLDSAKEMPYIESSKPCWDDYSYEGTEWTVYNELCAAVVSASKIYHQLTEDSLSQNYGKKMEDETWKRSNNYLKLSFSLLDAIEGAGGCGDDEVQYARHYNMILIQLIVALKDIYKTWEGIEDRFGAFDELPQHVATFRKIVIFIYNEFRILERSPVKRQELPSSFKTYLEVIYAYYTALEQHSKNEEGVAVGLVQYALVNTVEQTPIKSKLHIRRKKDKEQLKEKPLGSEQIMLSKQFKALPPLYKKSLETLARILKILYWKFSKLNDSITFQPVPDSQAVKEEYLFSSCNLPSGLQVPLNVKPYVPTSLSSSGAPRKYF